MKRNADSESAVTVDMPVLEKTYAHSHCLCGSFPLHALWSRFLFSAIFASGDILERAFYCTDCKG